MQTNADQSSPSLLNQVIQGLNTGNLIKATNDLADGWHHRHLWGTLGLHDVRKKYRRSTLGPFWITLSMGVMVSALGLLYGQIFGQRIDEYLPFLAAGFVIWGLISAMILEGCYTFIGAEGIIRQINAPLSIYAYKEVWSALIGFLHNILIFIIVATWFSKPLVWSMLLVFPALLMVLINGFWIVVFLGLLSARYRDVPLIVASVVQVVFFLTPIIWQPSMLPNRTFLLNYNPFFHLVEIMRAPLLGYAPAIENWIATSLIAIVGWLMTMILYSVYRWRIPYWV